MYKQTTIKLLICLFLTIPLSISAQSIKGTVTDAKTHETLPGVTITIKGTNIGTASDFDGNYQINVPAGKHTVVATYVSYATEEIAGVEVNGDKPIILDISLKESTKDLSEVVVEARKNMEAEKILMMDRKYSTIAVESMGAREMSTKGLSTVADGIKKITGISMEGNSKVLVRGLGDRYSMTSLNGFPIASPNPDNKLIPLTLFPTSVVKNVTVSKVYQPSVFGDYSGAHIDVETKENIGTDFITLGISTGGRINTLFSDFYSSDKTGAKAPYLGISGGLSLKDKIKDMDRGRISGLLQKQSVV
ncbi:carboxypeptidase-like regulatory domain-containing protein [Dysgonomonas sp. 511]|uniref:carboxypeptidase-like regulatory domain-containing protein n=1 Tax=Dysgonomonas sp. 511 TaxID=2302930 RepID=UPI0013D21105|nr:carboxypeptidase-like regulatory domain-containing protein [Dysgonomonas sp. 511]NDV80269.1 TonB-dependent receptor [Dysgonomonas sp. 511]